MNTWLFWLSLDEEDSFHSKTSRYKEAEVKRLSSKVDNKT